MYSTYMGQYGMYPQTQQIVKVNGENGARAYQMGVNSSALLLDETAALVWLVQTDGAGYKTVTPFTITQYVPEPEPDYRSLMARLTKLEERLNEKSDIAVVNWNAAEQSDGSSYQSGKG